MGLRPETTPSTPRAAIERRAASVSTTTAPPATTPPAVAAEEEGEQLFEAAKSSCVDAVAAGCLPSAALPVLLLRWWRLRKLPALRPSPEADTDIAAPLVVADGSGGGCGESARACVCACVCACERCMCLCERERVGPTRLLRRDPPLPCGGCGDGDSEFDADAEQKSAAVLWLRGEGVSSGPRSASPCNASPCNASLGDGREEGGVGAEE